jgi:hypothetical protein
MRLRMTTRLAPAYIVTSALAVLGCGPADDRLNKYLLDSASDTVMKLTPK